MDADIRAESKRCTRFVPLFWRPRLIDLGHLLRAIPERHRRDALRWLLIAAHGWSVAQAARWLERPAKTLAAARQALVIAVAETIREDGGRCDDALAAWRVLVGASDREEPE